MFVCTFFLIYTTDVITCRDFNAFVMHLLQ